MSDGLLGDLDQDLLALPEQMLDRTLPSNPIGTFPELIDGYLSGPLVCWMHIRSMEECRTPLTDIDEGSLNRRLDVDDASEVDVPENPRELPVLLMVLP